MTPVASESHVALLLLQPSRRHRNTHPLFIEALARLVERHVMETACSA